MRWLTFIRIAASVILIGTVCAACSDDVDADLSWESVKVDGFSADYSAVLFMSRELIDDGSDQGVLVFIGKHGEVRTLATGKLDNGMVATDEKGALSSWTSDETSIINGNNSVSTKSATKQAAGHGAVPVPGRGFAGIFNGGDIVWTDYRGKQASASIRDMPGAAGVLDDSLFVTNDPSDSPDGVLYQAKWMTGDVDEVMSWTPLGVGKGVHVNGYTRLFADDHALWYLEDIGIVPPVEGGAEPGRATSAQVRLARLDPKDATYATTVVKKYSRSSAIDDKSGWHPVALAAVDGHMHDSGLYYVDGNGKIVRVDIRSEKASEIGRLSPHAEGSSQALVAWRDAHMAVLTLGGQPSLETYSLDDGSLESTVEVPDLKRYMDKHQHLLPWSLALIS